VIELLEQTGALRCLLLCADKKRFITELRRSAVNPDGIASQNALDTIRHNLVELGLITEEMEEGPRPRTWLVITEKGKTVAQLIKRIQLLIEE